ncbi:MAG: PTS sugar transporter subunit IIB [Candidatus Eisenbacteria bacterium]
MRFALVRVDDRLLHGQVALGWGERLRPRFYLLADDRVAGDAWEAAACRAMAPAGSEVLLWSLERLAMEWKSLEDPPATVVLIRGLRELARLWHAGFRSDGGYNLGGLHACGQSRELLSYIHVNPEEEALLGTLLDEGADIFAQQLPATARTEAHDLRVLLASGARPEDCR